MNLLATLLGSRRRVLAFFVLLLVLAAGVFVAGVASAQTPTPTPGAKGANLDQSFWTSLASRLGITVDQLTQAVKDATKDTVTSALKANQITQDQANSLNQRADQWQPGQGSPLGKGPGGPGRGGWGHGGKLFGGAAVLDAAAKALGMTTADLTTALQSGKTLADIAKQKNVDVATVKQAMVDAAKAQVDQQQQAGRLTADQATQLKQRIDQEAANLDLSQPFFGHRGFFGPGGRNGGPGGRFSGPRQSPTPQTPAPSSSST